MLSFRRIIIGGTLAVIAIVVIAAAGWWFLIREDNKLATVSPQIPNDLASATVAATGSPGSPTTSDPLTFRIISDRSEAAFFADEKLASLPLPSKAKGTTKDISGDAHDHRIRQAARAGRAASNTTSRADIVRTRG